METPMCCRSDHLAGAHVEQAHRGRGDQPNGQRQPQEFDHEQNQNRKLKAIGCQLSARFFSMLRADG
jgi:hypothetical protein